MLANGKPELLVPASSLDVLKVAVMVQTQFISVGSYMDLERRQKTFQMKILKKE